MLKTTADISGQVEPREPGFAFLGRHGWIGFRCLCGYVVSARSLQSIQEALDDHQETYCPAVAQDRAEEAEA